ncbi:MAG: response regulator [Ignavibacteria bacterium]
MINIALVEDDNELREHLRTYFDSQKEFKCSFSVDSAENLLWHLKTSEPDIILMDIGLPGMSGIEAMKLVREKYPEVEIIMLTVYSDPQKIFDALCAGASGYLLKNAPFDELKASIIELKEGGAPMSPQIARKVINYFKPKKEVKESVLSDKEKEVVIGLVDGLSYKQIGERLFISFETVRSHIKNIYKKLHVHSKAEIIRKSFRDEI